jgi:hypothetical protein
MCVRDELGRQKEFEPPITRITPMKTNGETFCPHIVVHNGCPVFGLFSEIICAIAKSAVNQLRAKGS